MKTLICSILLMGICTTSFAEDYQNNYQCISVQGISPRISLSIVEEYSEAKLVSATAVVKSEGSVEALTVAVLPSSKPHPVHPEFMVLTWVAPQFKMDGYMSLLDGRRNFMATYAPADKDPIALSCYF